MEQGSGKKIYKLRGFDVIMILLIVLFAAGLFFCVFLAFEDKCVFNPWISASIMAICLETFLILFAVTIVTKKMFFPILIVVFLPSMFFAPVIGHVLVSVIAILITYRGLTMMRKTLFNMIKIDIATIISSGITYMSLSIVIIITSQYYFFIKETDKSMFESGYSTSNSIVNRMLKIDNKNVDTMTVDDFLGFVLRNMYNTSNVNFSEDITQKINTSELVDDNLRTIVAQKIEDEALLQMRNNLSEMIGREIGGSELIMRVFADVISTRVNVMMQQNSFLRENKNIIFTLVFFTILYSVASIVRIFVKLNTRLLFAIMKAMGVIKITELQKDVEVITM